MKWHLYIMLEGKQETVIKQISAPREGTAQVFDTPSRITALFNKIPLMTGNDKSDGS